MMVGRKTTTPFLFGALCIFSGGELTVELPGGIGTSWSRQQITFHGKDEYHKNVKMVHLGGGFSTTNPFEKYAQGSSNWDEFPQLFEVKHETYLKPPPIT